MEGRLDNYYDLFLQERMKEIYEERYSGEQDELDDDKEYWIEDGCLLVKLGDGFITHQLKSPFINENRSSEVEYLERRPSASEVAPQSAPNVTILKRGPEFDEELKNRRLNNSSSDYVRAERAPEVEHYQQRYLEINPIERWWHGDFGIPQEPTPKWSQDDLEEKLLFGPIFHSLLFTAVGHSQLLAIHRLTASGLTCTMEEPYISRVAVE